MILLGLKMKKTFLILACAAMGSVGAEAGYYAWVFKTLPSHEPTADLVLVYSGSENRALVARDWNGPGASPIFLFSGWDYQRSKLRKATGLADARFMVEDRAKTTDQNIRYSLPFIQGAGAQRLVLALPWYHLPRALFLTRFYLLGKGIAVEPYATIPVPKDWWRTWDFWREMIKFWGSLLRVVLSWFGIVDWPPHFGGV